MFVRSGGTWLFEAALSPDDSSAGDEFGTSMASDGSRLVVGAPRHAAGGAAYVFERTRGWTQTTRLVADGHTEGQRFGADVALSGERVIVGAPWGADAGSVAAVYVNGAQGWQLEGTLDHAGITSFGSPVAISGTVAAVGGYFANKVFVFSLVNGSWVETGSLEVPDPAAGADPGFGRNIALSGERLLVGAPAAHNGLSQTGVAYLFERAGASWTHLATFAPGDPQVKDSFGSSLALNDAQVVLGASTEAGAAAYVFRQSGTGGNGAWYEAGRWVGSVFQDLPPSSMAATPGTIAVGGRGCYHSTDFKNGCVRLFAIQVALEQVSPAIGPVGGGTTITLNGQYFSEGATVSFGGTPAASVSFVDARTLAAVTPPRAPGAVDVVVTIPGEAPSTLEDGFTYVQPPTISSVTPDHGGFGDWLTITGTGFCASRGTSYVRFGTVKCGAYVSWTSTRIRCRAPAKAVFGRLS
ncbi:MAG: IPT/TIG domain-containing protein, partial [Acidobacteria bacterium]|nr:IPT/TIG domain-containing protein [Acidobacteriota bacterium]